MKATLRPLFLFDVADSVQPRKEASAPAAIAKRHTATARYLGFDPPPVVLESPAARIAIFEFGVVSVTLTVAYEGDWPDLNREVCRMLDDPSIHAQARSAAQAALAKDFELANPYADWLAEDYLLVETDTATNCSNRHREIAALVRGESQLLSESETREVMSAALSCYPHDLLAAGWAAAFVSDTPEGAQSALQLIEFANAQLLELRHYDERLSHLLVRLQALQQRRRGGWLFRRWGAVREAESINEMRLDVMSLMEKSDNSLRVLGDMFYARAYRTIAHRIGVDDSRKVLEEKLQVAGESYRFVIEEFNHARAFFLEAMVVAILIFELAMALAKLH